MRERAGETESWMERVFQDRRRRKRTINRDRQGEDMKRRMSISIALVLGVVSLFLMSGGPTVRAAKERVFSIDTGIMTLGPNQVLRIVTNNKDPEAGYVVRFSQMTYSVTSSSGTSRYARVSQTTSDPMSVAPGEGFSIDIGTSENLRVVVSSDSPDLQVTAQIIDTTTGNIIAILIGLK
jgi:hypothetical protein